MSRDLATTLVALAVLKTEIAQVDADHRKAFEATAVVGDRTTAVLPDGTTIGHVQRKKGAKGGNVTATVKDIGQLVQWAQQHRPDLVTATLTPAAQTALLTKAKELGGYVDVESGEVLPLPGVDLSVSPDRPPVLEVRPTPDAAVNVRQAWRDGSLTLTSLLPLEAS